VLHQFENCLHAPNYTVFSNTTSAAEWNSTYPGVVVPLESPHNDIHLSVGGFDIPGQGESGQIAEANGDMGENNTAGMDPIFFFHHCNVDRMFWLWQKQNGYTHHLEVIDGYKGTSSSDSQGPTPGIAPGTPLDLDTPLNPFKKRDGTVYTSRDCVNIEEQLGFTYAPGSLDDEGELRSAPLLNVDAGSGTKKLAVRGIDRALFQGSFVLRAYATANYASGESKEYYLGHHSVLSRRNVIRCANCLTHLEVVAHFSLHPLAAEEVEHATYRVEIQHRGPAPAALATVPPEELAVLPRELKLKLQVSD
jgi:tyrosinase